MGKPIRVLHIIQRMEAGGSQALLMNLFRNIDRNKVQFDFLVLYPEHQFYDDEIRNLGGHIYYSTVRTDFNLLHFRRQFRALLKKHPEYRIIHVHAYTIGAFVLDIAEKCNIPVRIVHSHSNRMDHNFKAIPKILLQRMYTRNATDLFACSVSAGTYLYKNKPFEVLKNAIDTEKFVFNEEVRRQTRMQFHLENSFVLGNVGRLQPSKNHTFLLKTFVAAKMHIPNLKLMIIGSGDEENHILQQIKDYGIEQDVVLLKNRNDVANLYQAMDAFIFPSLYEGLGIVAVEAQAAGLPVLASTGVPDEAGLTDLFTRISLHEGVKAWANQIVSLYNHKIARTNTTQSIIDAGYDIQDVSNRVQSYYLKRYSDSLSNLVDR